MMVPKMSAAFMVPIETKEMTQAFVTTTVFFFERVWSAMQAEN